MPLLPSFNFWFGYDERLQFARLSHQSLPGSGAASIDRYGEIPQN
jgi:hypothetical protein